MRDQRLIAIVTSLTFLTDGLLRVGREPLEKLARIEPDVAGPEPLPKKLDAFVLVRLARLEWRRAVYLASIIDNPTYRNEMLYKVAESEASGSATIANDYATAAEFGSLADRAAADDQTKDAKRPNLDEQARQAQATKAAYKKLADEILIDSFEDAKKIDRLDLEVSRHGADRTCCRRFRAVCTRRRACSRNRTMASRVPRPCCSWPNRCAERTKKS